MDAIDFILTNFWLLLAATVAVGVPINIAAGKQKRAERQADIQNAINNSEDRK